MNYDEIADSSLLNVLEDIKLGDSDGDLVPKGDLFCRCASIPGMHEIKNYKPKPLKSQPKHNTFSTSTPVPLATLTIIK